MKEYPIGIIDSGIGGVSILNECVRVLPNENYVYYADNKNSPYGNKSRKFIQGRIDDIVCELINEHKIKVLVIACNTASTICAEKIRAKFKLPVIAMEPYINKLNGTKTLIMGTKHTLKNKNVVKFLKNNKDSKGLAIARLAKEIDNNIYNLGNILSYLKECLYKYQKENYNNVVIGCTHYNFIKKQLREIFTNANVISCEKEVVRQIERVLVNNELKSNLGHGSLKILLSKEDKKIERFINDSYFCQLKIQK